MTYTKHGWHIPGTSQEDPPIAEDCGGVVACPQCHYEWEVVRMEQDKIANEATPRPDVLVDKAKFILVNHLNRVGDRGFFSVDQIAVVWFSKTLQNWKALLILPHLENQLYYEVTHNGDKKETYIDTYVKVDNVAIPD